MKKWLLMLLILAEVVTLRAQHIHYVNDEGIEVFPAQIDPVTGDTVPVVVLKNLYCFNRKRFKGSKYERDYWRMVNDVKKTLPIAKEARRLLVIAYDTCQVLSNREQSRYFKQLEKELWVKYKPQLKKLNYRQGKLLVRLIDRECNKQSYQIIREFLGRTRAVFWQGFGSLFGVSLKSEWEPDGKDKELEDICIQVEQGMI
ncbi:MAG: DUF4294 domain-containing protein [Bacteroidales bacterium]|nr:DUF4294 domain-containing protein [Bacteroidales bacterium]MBP5680228.1 DUF4294 domain-containing protein [Bacteroidales bacterium]